ncbi:MAG: hypothetical protein AAGK97_03410 [Bacteroidota bacterium]
MAYDNFGVLAIKAIQEQQELISLLEKQLTKTEQALNAQKAEIQSLKNMMKSIQLQLKEKE